MLYRLGNVDFHNETFYIDDKTKRYAINTIELLTYSLGRIKKF